MNKLSNIFSHIKQILVDPTKSKLSDCLLVVGLLAISYGVWQIFPPAGIISAGLFLVLIAWLLS